MRDTGIGMFDVYVPVSTGVVYVVDMFRCIQFQSLTLFSDRNRNDLNYKVYVTRTGGSTETPVRVLV